MKILFQLLFAFFVVGGLISLHLGEKAGIANTIVSLVLQLFGGTLFAVGFLGEGVQPLSAWVNRYLAFSRDPIISLAPLMILLNIVALILLQNRDEDSKMLLNFVSYGVALVFIITQLAQSNKLLFLVRCRFSSLLRFVLIIIGFLAYWFGLQYMG